MGQYTEKQHLEQTLEDAEKMHKSGTITTKQFKSTKRSVEKRLVELLGYGSNSCRQYLSGVFYI